MSRSKFQSSYEKRIQAQDQVEEALILTAKYKPNEKAVYQNSLVRIVYPTVRDGNLSYLVERLSVKPELRNLKGMAWINESQLSLYSI